MGTKTCYLFVLIWIIWKSRTFSFELIEKEITWFLIGSRVIMCSVPDPCPEIQPSTQVTDMCQAGSAVEDISESNAGNLKYDHVTLRARIQEDNCVCHVFTEKQSLNSFMIYIEPHGKLQNSPPKESECGLELYLDFYDKETLQTNQITDPIKCTSGHTDRSLSLTRNSVLRFASKVIGGNFTRGYCIDIKRVHVNGQNGTLKMVCDAPGLIPAMNLTTTQSTDHPTGQPSSGSSSSTIKDESTVYIAIGGSAGGLLILVIVVLVIIFYRRKFSEKNIKKTETSKTDTIPTNAHDDPDYNGLKYNMLYVSADNQDAVEGDYHTVDNNQEPTHRKVSDHDISYSTVDDVACSSFNTVATHEVVKNTNKGLGYENSEGKEIAKREQNISQEGNSNTYAVVDKRRIIGKNHNKKAALSPVYAVVDKTGKLKIENK